MAPIRTRVQCTCEVSGLRSVSVIDLAQRLTMACSFATQFHTGILDKFDTWWGEEAGDARLPAPGAMRRHTHPAGGDQRAARSTRAARPCPCRVSRSHSGTKRFRT